MQSSNSPNLFVIQRVTLFSNDPLNFECCSLSLFQVNAELKKVEDERNVFRQRLDIEIESRREMEGQSQGHMHTKSLIMWRDL